MINCFYDCYVILNKVYADKSYLKQAINSTQIEEKNRSLTVKTCYGVLDKDIELSYYISYLAPKSPKLVIRTILKIAMYFIKYLKKHDYAVTKNAVELTKKLGKGGASGFVNAFLRKFISADIPLPTNNIKNLSIKYSYPEFLVELLINDYGTHRAEKIMASENKKTCLSFYNENGEEYLKSRSIPFDKTPYDNVFLLDNFSRNSDYDKGIYTYQSLGSVAICDVVESGEDLIDVCSAPGGKSINLSRKFNTVTSLDIHEHRVNLIEEYKSRMKVDNITTCVHDSKILKDEFIDKFDAVLCDVPCSGTGVINDNPDIKLNRSIDSINELLLEQYSILSTCSKYVKKGGFLYYSTCSILKSENIDIIKRFLTENVQFELQKINSKLPCETDGFVVQYLPDVSFGNGFFVAKLKRVL